jgi:hypothetical protein
MTTSEAKIEYYALSRTSGCPIPGEARHLGNDLNEKKK